MAEEKTQSVFEMSDEEFLAKENEIMTNDKEEAKNNTQETSTQEQNEESTTNEALETNNNENQEPEDVDYKAFYEEVTAPFTANGQQFSAKNSKEVISLMQKGTDYTRKTQQLSAKRKILDFLEKQDLLDNSKLELLADISKGNKNALKKLIKDKKIDVIDLEDYSDEDTPNEYIPEARMPSDSAIALNDTIDSISKQQNGLDMLNNIRNTYDQTSIGFLANNPDLLNDLYNHKMRGIYDKIKAEVDRRITFNQLNPNVPFISNYAHVYTEMYPNDMQSNNVVTQPYLNNGYSSQMNNQIRGAKNTTSRGKSEPSGKKKVINYLEMSDEDFLKQYG